MLVWNHLLWCEDEIQAQEVQCTQMQKPFSPTRNVKNLSKNYHIKNKKKNC